MTSRPWRRAAAALLVAAALAASSSAAEAQRPRPVAPPPGVGNPGSQDPLGRGLGGRDSTTRATLVEWSPEDSVMLALLARKGYTVVRYQAGTVAFDAQGRVMTLVRTDSARAAVQRDSTLLVADSIQFNDSTKVVSARGDTIVMRDPSRGEDVIGRMEMTYDVERREGRTRDFSTVANAGEDWRVQAHQAAFSSDSTGDRTTVYGRDGLLTSCLDSVPHYHFLAKELKRVSGNVIVARPAIFYIQDVPVFWFPFIFQDIRDGRRSGILTPRLGFAELVRNSPSYRRTAENIGYYFAISDYVDAQVSMDWRSSARATQQDPGWTRLNGELRYRWLDRFISGTLALSQSSLSSGSRNTAVSLAHNQEFSSRTRLTTNLNYVTSTQVQRQTIINPLAAVATIGSQLNLVRTQGPFSVNIGGSRRQYPGRDQVDQNFPSINVSSKPLELGEWFVTTPSLQYSTSQQLQIDAAGDFAWRYTDVGGVLDSVRLKRNSSATTLTLGTPFKIFDFQVQSGIRFSENINDYPSIRTLIDPSDTTRRVDRVFQKTFLSTADFDVSLGLPQLLQGTWNVAPSITASNVDPSGFFVRSERTGGAWVSQSKRLSYGIGVTPTLFRLYPGFGRIQRIRHSVSPTLSYSYSPAARVSDEFLAALGRTRTGYLGALAQNRVSLGLAMTVEAKLKGTSDSADAQGEKIRLASLQFTSFSYDFERKAKTGSGFSTDRFGYTFRSDLLPGFDLGVDYSLFQGDVLSDTAVFKPYRESVRASFALNGNSAIVRGIGRLFGAQPPERGAPAGGSGAPSTDPMQAGLGSGRDAAGGMAAVTGTRSRGAVQEIPSGAGFQAAFTVSAQRQRQPVGGRIVDYDPAVKCQPLLGLPNYDTCVLLASQTPPNDLNTTPSTVGGTFFRVPPTTSVGVRTSFNLTPKWAASWSTNYDVERSEFASQVVTLQRELHDWRAIFGFTRAPNGNFAFTFFISLKAQPEIKLDYDRQTYRPPSTTSPSTVP
ncbi:MAG: hypothetical protein KJZ74_10680 [Gemmatimonadales bacterium]|nr:LPS-assembly protein LptD [Gemmatimonadota bacterium]MCL4214371.1 hypothetical protein [Gemmatimonadales bacterium]